MTTSRLWLLARLAVHHEFNRKVAVNRQEVLWGIELNSADRLEVARLTLALAEAKYQSRWPATSEIRLAHERDLRGGG